MHIEGSTWYRTGPGQSGGGGGQRRQGDLNCWVGGIPTGKREEGPGLWGAGRPCAVGSVSLEQSILTTIHRSHANPQIGTRLFLTLSMTPW